MTQNTYPIGFGHFCSPLGCLGCIDLANVLLFHHNINHVIHNIHKTHTANHIQQTMVQRLLATHMGVGVSFWDDAGQMRLPNLLDDVVFPGNKLLCGEKSVGPDGMTRVDVH